MFVPKQFVRDLTGEKNFQIGGFVNGFADQIHTNAGPDGGDVVCTQ